jgi:hypothetical protein
MLPLIRSLPQLPIPRTGRKDCVCVALLSEVESVSNGAITIRGVEDRARLVHSLRREVGSMPPPKKDPSFTKLFRGHSLDEADRQMESKVLAQEFAKVGLKPPRFRKVGDIEVAIRDGLDRDDAVVHFHGWYVVLSKRHPELAGQIRNTAFSHAFAAQGLWVLKDGKPRFSTEADDYVRVHFDMGKCDGTAGHRAHREGDDISVRVAEGLLDGRENQDGRMAKGSQYWPIGTWRRSMERNRFTDAADVVHVYGRGRMSGGIVRSAKPIDGQPLPRPEPGPTPQPEPPSETDAEAIARLTKRIHVLEDALEKAEAARVEAEMKLEEVEAARVEAEMELEAAEAAKVAAEAALKALAEATAGAGSDRATIPAARAEIETATEAIARADAHLAEGDKP